MNKLHPGARWIFRFAFYGIMVGILLGIVWVTWDSGIIKFISAFSVTAYIILALILGEIYSRMSYDRWFYELTNEGVRLERGIIWKRYTNIPYGRIQNIDINRGIFAQMLGFSSLAIQTAGSAQPNAEGYIPALESGLAEKVRADVMKRITSRGK